MPDRPRCGNCAYATTTDEPPALPQDLVRVTRQRPTRLHCHREPTPTLLQNGVWPRVFYEDSCGYWRVPESDGKVDRGR